MDPIELVTTGVAVGGDGIARDGDGRVVFVEGALVGERVLAEIVETKKSFGRGRVIEVLEASPGRVAPVCPEVTRGCGGCDLAHASLDHQHMTKAAIVDDSLRRIGRLRDVPPIGLGPELAPTGFRTTVRAGVSDGRAGLRRRRSNELLSVESCRVTHPSAVELLVEGRFADATEVVIRVGARTGERMVVTDGDPARTDVPDDVQVVAAGSSGFIHEQVAGHRFRISSRSFFQTRADGAEALVATVADALGAATGTLVDLCSGVGLFAATVAAGRQFERVVAVESNRSAVEDARVNLAGPVGGTAVDVVRSTFERWEPVPADVVIADPSRVGLGRSGVANVVATGARTVALVSCDAGSLGRDAGLFVEAGYRVDDVTLVDLFPDTSHVEVVTTYRRQT